jgi:predicted anti-sigma-YlaC factor YlaD
MTHLTDEQMAEWLAGEAGVETERHVAECSACAAETSALADGVHRYGLAVKHRAREAEQLRLLQRVDPRRELVRHRLRWAVALTLGMALAGTTAYVTRPQPPQAEPAAVKMLNAPPAVEIHPASATGSTAQKSMSDDELLEAVNNDLSRDVPQALAPVSAITEARNRIAATSTVAGSTDNSTKQ